MSSVATVPIEPPTVGGLLRRWRERRLLSQLELSHQAGVSTRHLSYVENGRSRPTAKMILHLAEHMDVPRGERDVLLLAAGFAPRHEGRGLEDREVAAVMDGLRDLLNAHLPYPALLLDRHWDIVDTNAAVDVLLDGCAAELLEPPVNALRVSLHPRGLAPRIRNLDSWATHLRRQVASRLERTHDPRLALLVDELASYLPSIEQFPEPASSPVLVLELMVPTGTLRLFSVASQLEMPTDSTLEGLHLETFLPADEATRGALRLAGRNA